MRSTLTTIRQVKAIWEPCWIENIEHFLIGVSSRKAFYQEVPEGLYPPTRQKVPEMWGHRKALHTTVAVSYKEPKKSKQWLSQIKKCRRRRRAKKMRSWAWLSLKNRISQGYLRLCNSWSQDSRFLHNSNIVSAKLLREPARQLEGLSFNRRFVKKKAVLSRRASLQQDL